ncbi:MAG: serine protease [Solirubrobacteraceae bacterium]|nr:serine protease [Solirubrobacteraceae bacterium]MEA2241825.1 serine protease [Solirubrobacteraceae bacterium]
MTDGRGITDVLGAACVALLATLACAPAASAAPAAAYEPHTLIVKYAGAAPSAQRSLVSRTAGVLQTVGRLAGVGAQLVRVAGDPAAVAARLQRSGTVVYAEPNYIYHATAIPDDPLFGQQYGLDNTGQLGGAPDADIDAPEGWDALGLGSFPAGGGVTIGIVDTGIDAGHEDLAGKLVTCAGVRSFGLDLLGIPLLDDPTIVPGRCADDNGHGTHVAGIAAARANNGLGIAGVAFNSPLAVCKALNGAGAGTLAALANCIAYLSGQGAKIISLSLGGPGSATLGDAVAAATSNGALIVAAAGNSGDAVLNYPAAYPKVVSVAAVDRNGARAPFSNANSDVEVAAPGVDVLSTWNDGGYRTESGTSMAAPYVAGVAALIAGRDLAGGPAAWRSKLTSAVDDLGALGRDSQFGFGRVNLQKALGG